MLNIVTEQEVAKIFKLSVPKLKRDRANKTGLPFSDDIQVIINGHRYNLSWAHFTKIQDTTVN